MVYQKQSEKHKQQYPNARGIRRACSKELYRTIKRLKIWLSPEQIKDAETIYVKKVMLNLPFIVDHGSNRRALADWFDEQVGPEIAPIWKVELEVLNDAFRDAFGG
ncbi:dehydrogenase [Paenibacillus pectinilyticus]|uniref:Dehydrogenase n=1 Tax=Paenibacillus pectinilyticus TaxID=512399 RepID=A0A1C1A2M9_9BACL|nr:dehydrogenase [Paenibacillus pectinilyticus]OCT14789.1 dehydrogenase [Paenibacillus pectinilyticus]